MTITLLRPALIALVGLLLYLAFRRAAPALARDLTGVAELGRIMFAAGMLAIALGASGWGDWAAERPALHERR